MSRAGIFPLGLYKLNAQQLQLSTAEKKNLRWQNTSKEIYHFRYNIRYQAQIS
jgi:hypothetical protein